MRAAVIIRGVKYRNCEAKYIITDETTRIITVVARIGWKLSVIEYDLHVYSLHASPHSVSSYCESWFAIKGACMARSLF